MHLLLLELLQQPCDEGLLAFMRVDEMLIDIGDDLTDYEDDVMANSFNIYRGAVIVLGHARELARNDPFKNGSFRVLIGPVLKGSTERFTQCVCAATAAARDGRRLLG
jgi:hypothetical protein